MGLLWRRTGILKVRLIIWTESSLEGRRHSRKLLTGILLSPHIFHNNPKLQTAHADRITVALLQFLGSDIQLSNDAREGQNKEQSRKQKVFSFKLSEKLLLLLQILFVY